MPNSGTPFGFPEGLLGQPPSQQQFTSDLHVCEVHDTLAYGHCYLVKPLTLPRMPAMLGSQASSMLPVGARDAAMLYPGSLVLCWISEGYYPVILCVLAAPTGSSQLGFPDSIVAAGHAGLFADQAHQIVTGKETSHGFFDFSAGRPIDNVAGDWGHFNELGMGFFLGKLFATIRASEMCKTEYHYVDQLLRHFGYNYQHYTAGSELEAFADEGEWTRIDSYTPYPLEATGQVLKVDPSFKTIEGANPKSDKDEFGIEPQDPRQTGLFRYREFAGLLGDLRHRYVMVPSSQFHGGDEFMRFGREASDRAAYIGVFEELLGLDGSYRMRSAKSVMFEKTIWIPVPEEAAPRDNPEGDTDFDPITPVAEYPSEDEPGANMDRDEDRTMYQVQSQLVQGLNTRDKDWHMRDSRDGDAKINTPGDEINGQFEYEEGPLSPYSDYEQPMPESKDLDVRIDRTQKYYQGKAKFGFTDDGGFIMEDAYGAYIKSVGGNIEIGCPGDVVSRPGRTVQMWAGKDVVIKARQDVDISSSERDVRFKAERNLFALGGNDGTTGGVLIENRASGDPDFEDRDDPSIGGLIIKSSRGNMAMYGQHVRLTSLGEGITLDGNGMDDEVIVYGKSMTEFMRLSKKEVMAPQAEETPVRSMSLYEHESGGHFKMLGSSLDAGVGTVNFMSTSSGSGTTSLNMKGSLTVEGSISAKSISEGSPNVGQPAFKAEATQEINETKRTLTAYYNVDINNSTALGNEKVYGFIGFGFRSSVKLELGSFKMYEAPWQRRFRQTSSIDAANAYDRVWEEKNVYGRVTPEGDDDENLPTMPFPGYEAWENGEGGEYIQVDQQFYERNGSGGRPLPRGEKGKDYSKVEPPDPEGGAFKDRYPINKTKDIDQLAADLVAALGGDET